jgi:LDH2 family malate/lactate/ureidoglycolate dehydrogenase
MTNKFTESRIPVSVLHTFCCNALEFVGVPANEAAIVADSLTKADARGLSSHGIVRLLPVYIYRLQIGSTRPKPNTRVVQSDSSAALIDGDAGAGQVVGYRAMEKAIEMARETGAGVVGVRNSSHFGTAAFFLEQATKVDMIGIAMTNAPSNMPPYGGREPYFGTNPLGIGLPCQSERPVILDMSTSVVAKGKITMAYKNGEEEIPLGWAIDENGQPTRSTAAALRGAMLPMAGHKGAGLALIIDALCGVLTGAAFSKHIVSLYDEGERHQNVGHFFIAVNVETFVPAEIFKSRMDAFVQDIRAQPRQPGVERIYVPYEIEYEQEEKNRRLGILLSKAGWQELNELAARLGVTPLAELLDP